MPTPEAAARIQIDAALAAAGWAVQDSAAANPFAAPGVAIREFPLKRGHGFADYLLYVGGKAVGVSLRPRSRATPSPASRGSPPATARACPTTSRPGPVP